MCLSPHEMTTSDIRETIAAIQGDLDDNHPAYTRNRESWEWKIEMFKEILRDRQRAMDIGKEVREVEFEPFPVDAPVEEPVQVPVPVEPVKEPVGV